MVNFLLGMLTCYIICGVVTFVADEYLGDYFAYAFFVPFYVLGVAVLSIPRTLWEMFRNVFRPTTFQHLAWAKKRDPKHWHDYGYWGYCYDPTAKYLYQKFFFYRIKKGLTS